MQLCSKKQCTGCMACYNICRAGVINIESDSEGFLRPAINQSKCIGCSMCQRVCPQIHPQLFPSNEKIVYACWNRSKKLRKRSTSGGAFSAFARTILGNKGIIFGAGFSDDLRVVHKAIDAVSGLDELRGSKYVQSEVGITFQQVKKALADKKQVLFSGTPCQISGLYAFLGKRYPGQLWTIDLVCHGVPSPMVFKDYLRFMEDKYGASVNKVFFRNKKPGWFVYGMKLMFSNGEVYESTTYDDPYIRGFLREYYLQPACHTCKYANTNRVADITLADFWGYQETCRKDRDDDKGISMVMLNTDNGKALFEQSKGSLTYFTRPVEQAVAGNQALRKCFSPSPKRESFWNDYHTHSFAELVDLYLYPEDKQYFPSRKEMHRKQDIDYLVHLPNRVMQNLLGDEKYKYFKKTIKKILSK